MKSKHDELWEKYSYIPVEKESNTGAIVAGVLFGIAITAMLLWVVL